MYDGMYGYDLYVEMYGEAFLKALELVARSDEPHPLSPPGSMVLCRSYLPP